MKKLLMILMLTLLIPVAAWPANVEVSTAGTNIGIGTTSSKNALSVKDRVAIGSATYTSVTAPANSLIVEGNVGIGTPNPGVALAVGSTSQFKVTDAGVMTGVATNVTGLPISTGVSGLGTGIATALAVNTGSAGAPVLFNGALGTPSSGIATNLSGTSGITQAAGWTDGGTTLVESTTTDAVGIGTTTVADGILQIGGDNVAIGIGGTNTNATGAGELYVKGDLEVDGTTYLGTGSTVNGQLVCTADGTNCPASGSSGWTDGGTNVFTSTTTDTVGIGTTTPNATSLEIVKRSSTKPFKISSTATGNGDYLVVRSNGNVGIGTIEPTSVLQVNGSISTIGTGVTGVGSTTGILLDGANATPSAAGLQVTTGNNVGIGTTTAATKLVVSGTVTATAFSGDGSALTGIGAGGWTDGGTNVYTATTTDNVGIGTTSPSGNLEIVESGEAPLMVSLAPTGDGDMLIVTSVGNIGIGTISPQKKFHIYDTNNAADFRIQDTLSTAFVEFQVFTDQGEAFDMGVAGGGVADTDGPNRVYFYQNLNAPLIFGTSATNRLSINGGGNVGIGTALSWGSPFEVRNTTSSIWSVKSAANTACNTTCISACVAGMDSATNGNEFLACTDATADSCLCAGSN